MMAAHDPPPASHATARRFAGNALWLVGADLIGKVASFGFVLIVARELGPRSYGLFAFLLSFVPLFLVFSRMGLISLVTTEIARDRRRLSRVFSSGLVMLIVLGAAGAVLAAITAPLFVSDADVVPIAAVVALALLIDELANFCGAVFRAFETMKFYAIQTFVNRTASLVFAVAILSWGGDLLQVSLGYLVGSLLALITGTVMLVMRFPRIDLRDARRDVMRDIWRRGIPLAIAGVMGVLLFRLDSVMLQVMRGSVDVGLYNVAYRFLDSFLFVTFALSGVAFSRVSRLGRSSSARLTMDLTAAAQMAFYLPIPVVMWFSGEWIITTIFGQRYGEAASAVVWLTAAGIVYAIAYLARLALISLDRRRAIGWIAGAALAVNVGINLYAIPAYGIVGAAAATLIAQGLEAALLLKVLAASDMAPSPRLTAIPLTAAAVMGLAMWIAPVDGGLELSVAAAAYALALGGFARLLAPHEFARVLAVLRRPDPASREALTG